MRETERWAKENLLDLEKKKPKKSGSCSRKEQRFIFAFWLLLTSGYF